MKNVNAPGPRRTVFYCILLYFTVFYCILLYRAAPEPHEQQEDG